MLDCSFKKEEMKKKIRYQFPPNSNANPFDIVTEGKYFIEASGFSYLFDEIDLDEISRFIPMGYKTLIVLERLNTIENGTSLREFSISNINPNGYIIVSLDPIKIELKIDRQAVDSNIIYKPDNLSNSIYEATWIDYHECLLFALKVSEELKTRVIVCKIQESYSWH